MNAIQPILKSLLQCITVITSLYGFIAICKNIISWWKKKRSKAIVLLNSDEWAIITPRYNDNFQRKEDVLSAIKIRDWCHSLGTKCNILDDHDPIPEGKNLFFICGPKANKKVALFYKGFNLQLSQFGADYSIVDNICDKKMSSITNSDGKLKVDYAILSRRFDKSTGRSYLFCMGIHGHGTLGAAHMLTTGLASTIVKNAPNLRNFESVVSVPYIDDYCSLADISFDILPRE